MPSPSRSASAGRRLVIVESPTKARTIAGFLGDGYVVESSMGHVRDLPQNAAEVPARFKAEPWARLGVDVDHDFKPVYVVTPAKRATVKKLKGALDGASELYLATDEDREGEAIAWHLREELKPRVPVRRMVFHEITPEAIAAALANPRDVDERLVDAQEARRVLDRLYGYEVSAVLWKKVMPRLSAGRVQSVATRLVVDRERERIAFTPAGYFDLTAELDAGAAKTPRTFTARLAAVGGQRVAAGRDFGADGALKAGAGVVHLDRERAEGLAAGLAGAPFAVASVEAKPYRRSPYPPFRTTTLQQEASRKLGFGAARTMQVAQRLYENGHITYMRTDSVTLSDTAVTAARAQAVELFGERYVPERPRRYTSKVKNAQEAHEAIRPAGERFRTPGATGLSGEEFRLYELIWMRTVASQMRDAEGRSVSVRVGATVQAGPDAGTAVELAASGRVITFSGFLAAYVEGSDDPEAELDSAERPLPDVAAGDPLTPLQVAAEGHETRPPARYTEATLVRELEEREIGRPSTYATIIGTILDRGYVDKRGQALVPTWLAFAVTRLLETHFGRLVDYDFTARMEDVLDEIARGDADMRRWLTTFYFGNGGTEGLKALVGELGGIDARENSTFPLGDGVVVRVGRYGPYVEDGSGSRANVPEDLAPDELTVAKARELLASPAGGEERVLGVDPATGHTVVARAGRFGPYVTEAAPDGAATARKAPRPRTASLFASMDLATVTLQDALRLLSLPRTVGVDGATGEPVTAQNGRYGPFLKRGTETRSLASEEDIFTVDLPTAEKLFAEPKRRGRAAAAAAGPLRELGADPATGKPVVVKEGRFGPYVTDGEVNATLRRDDDPTTVTLERAAALLADKRARGPAPRRRAGTRASTGRASTGTRAKGRATPRKTARPAR